MRNWFVLSRTGSLVASAALLFLGACSAPKQPAVQDLTHHEDFSDAKMMTLRGTRDGATLDAEAMFSGRAMILTVKLRFAIGTPTMLQSGTWQRSGSAESGTVAARDVSFLGGQGGSPSIGGTFDLIDASGTHKYRVVIPLLELTERLDPKRTEP